MAKRKKKDATRNLKGLLSKLGLGEEDLVSAFNLVKSDQTVEMLSSENEHEREIAFRSILRKVRYWCFRFKNEATGGASADGAPAGLREIFEGQKEFKGWEQFGVTWDVNKGDMVATVPRLYTLEEEWEAVLRQVVPTFGVQKVQPDKYRTMIPAPDEEES